MMIRFTLRKSEGKKGRKFSYLSYYLLMYFPNQISLSSLSNSFAIPSFSHISYVHYAIRETKGK